MGPNITRTYIASGAIAGRTFVKLSADDTVTKATAATDAIFGVSERLDVADGERVDVVIAGLAEVVAGGDLTRGTDVTADANGKAVACAPDAGEAARRGGIVQAAAASGDYVEVMVAPATVTTPAA
jgi:hypothetical protein